MPSSGMKAAQSFIHEARREKQTAIEADQQKAMERREAETDGEKERQKALHFSPLSAPPVTTLYLRYFEPTSQAAHIQAPLLRPSNTHTQTHWDP